MTAGRRTLVKVGVAAGAALAALALVAGPQASASTGGSVKGYGNLQFANQSSSPDGSPTILTNCSDVFTGPVTADNGSGGIEANIDRFSFGPCESGTSVTAIALPWTLNLQEDSNYTIEGFAVDITTPRGTCRYSGPVRGDMEFPGGIYTLTGQLTRQTDGCGGTAQIAVGDETQVISINS
jgi:hypothetical protein